VDRRANLIDRAAVTEARGPHTKSAGDPRVNAVKQQAVQSAIIGGGIGFAAGAFTGFNPYCLLLVPLERLVAKKLHALTRTYSGGETTRLGDLVDLLLVRQHEHGLYFEATRSSTLAPLPRRCCP